VERVARVTLMKHNLVATEASASRSCQDLLASLRRKHLKHLPVHAGPLSSARAPSRHAHAKITAVQLLFCGTRGSIASPGAEFVRYGGHTSCVAISHDGMPPTLVLDGGTGLRNLSRHLGTEPFQGAILLGHLHWDHTQGLPFFRAAEHPDSRVTLFMPAQGDPVEVLSRALCPPHFPLRPDELRGRWRFRSLEPGSHSIEGFAVTAADIPHPGGRTFGYQISDSSGAVAYLSDHSPTTLGPGTDGLGEYHSAVVELVSGVDVLVHDAQHLAAELPEKHFLGHAAIEYAIGLARHCGVPRVVLFHHDPDRTDDELDDIVARSQGDGVSVAAAMEGHTIEF
jgi:phosphoribosyl 1,2-cyclic phosphodiesterase